MDTDLLKIIAYIVGGGGIILLMIIRYSAKPKKCNICGSDTKDMYRETINTDIYLCRNHLIERWKKDFISSPFDMIVIEPDFIKYPYAYLYGTVSHLKQWLYPKEAQENITHTLDSIKEKNCNTCSNKASIAFFKKEDYEYPFMEKIKPANTFLCKDCAVKKIEPHLRNSQQNFIEGVYAPTEDRGIYHVQEY